MANPNFPENLRIEPSEGLSRLPGYVLDNNCLFDASAQREAIGKYGIAGRIWEAAYILLLYLDPPSGWQFDPPFQSLVPLHSTRAQCFIELGSGSGIISHYVSQIRDDARDVVVATDLPEVCPLLETNLRTSSSNLVIRPLTWGNTDEAQGIYNEVLNAANRTLTHIICSDLVYFPELLAPLLRTLIQLTSPPFSSTTPSGPQTVIMSYKVRSLAKESMFWSAFGLWFTFHPVLFKNTSLPWTRTGADEAVPFIFIAHRRPASWLWAVPSDDQDLLHGVGAQGTSARKYDDTFEIILLMSVGDSDDND